MDFDKRDVMAGLLVVAAVAVLLGALFVVNRGRFLGKSFHISARLPDMGGLEKGLDVVYKGYKAGTVERVTLSYEPSFVFIVRMDIDRQIRLYEGTSVMVRSKGLMGSRYLELMPPPGETGVLLAEGAVVPVVTEGDIMAKAGEVLSQVEKIMGRLKTADTAGQLHGVVADARILVQNLSATMVSARILVEENRASLRKSLDGAQGVTTQLDGLLQKRGPELDRILRNADQSLSHMPAILMNVEELTEDLKRNPWRLLRKGDSKDVPPKLDHNHALPPATAP
ncbi:MAG TPA: hypothetical protein DD417_13445 [Elusimicrobia bacterium]|nr:hypothetical protein [Elusimicrobiota bacterium]